MYFFADFKIVTYLWNDLLYGDIVGPLGGATCIMYILLNSKSHTANLGQFISCYEKYKEQVSFQTIVVGILVLVITNGNKIFIYLLKQYNSGIGEYRNGPGP